MIKIIVISLFVFVVLIINNLIMDLLTGLSLNRSITYFLQPFQVMTQSEKLFLGSMIFFSLIATAYIVYGFYGKRSS